MELILIGVGIFAQLFVLFAIYKVSDDMEDFLEEKLK